METRNKRSEQAKDKALEILKTLADQNEFKSRSQLPLIKVFIDQGAMPHEILSSFSAQNFSNDEDTRDTFIEAVGNCCAMTGTDMVSCVEAGRNRDRQVVR